MERLKRFGTLPNPVVANGDEAGGNSEEVPLVLPPVKERI